VILEQDETLRLFYFSPEILFNNYW